MKKKNRIKLTKDEFNQLYKNKNLLLKIMIKNNNTKEIETAYKALYKVTILAENAEIIENGINRL